MVADNQESIKNSLHNLDTFTTSLARNSEKIDSVMLKVDGVMGKADNLMLGLNTLAGGKEGGELFLAVKSIRELAEDFDKRSGALMSDGRRTLGDISRAVNNLDRNPTRLLFGAGNSGRAGGGAAAEAGARLPRRRKRDKSEAVAAPRTRQPNRTRRSNRVGRYLSPLSYRRFLHGVPMSGIAQADTDRAFVSRGG